MAQYALPEFKQLVLSESLEELRRGGRKLLDVSFAAVDSIIKPPLDLLQRDDHCMLLLCYARIIARNDGRSSTNFVGRRLLRFRRRTC